MKLLNQIQEDAADSTKDLGDLLRRCRILASKLPQADFEAWVDQELNGYRDSAAGPLPRYRLSSANAHGLFLGPMGSYILDTPIPSAMLDEEHRLWAESVELREPIAIYVDLLKMPPGGSFKVDWPTNLIGRYARRFYQGNYSLHAAWQDVSRNQIVGVVDAVRNRVLMLSLDLAKAVPEIGQSEEFKPLAPEAEEKVSQVVHFHIYGSVGNVSAGTSELTQNASIQVRKGDFAGLKKVLKEMGVTTADVNELEAAILRDGSVADRIGSNTSRWLEKMLEKARSGAWEVALSRAGTILPRLLCRYFGLPQ